MSSLKAMALSATTARQGLVAEPCAVVRRKHHYANGGAVRPFVGRVPAIERTDGPM
jgi:hypothetical protein